MPPTSSRGLSVLAAGLALTTGAGVAAAAFLPAAPAAAARVVARPALAPATPDLDAASRSRPLPLPAPVAPVPADPPAATAAAAPAVAPLGRLSPPDLLVTTARSLSAQEVAAVGKLPGVTSVVPTATGVIGLPGGPVHALGVDPSVFRGVAPLPTATSDALWQSVARGELLETYDTAHAQASTLGATVPVAPTTPAAAATAVPTRVGAFAELRLPGVGALVGSGPAQALGLLPSSGLIIVAPSRDAAGLQKQVSALLASAAPHTELLRPVLASAGTYGRATMSKQLYQRGAATCPGLPWSVLAAIGGIESAHGADTAVSSAGAEGPMQFLPATFDEYAVDGDGDGKTSILDPADAVFTAARMLCANGAGLGGDHLRQAIFAYNHADWYVDDVLALADRYARG